MVAPTEDLCPLNSGESSAVPPGYAHSFAVNAPLGSARLFAANAPLRRTHVVGVDAAMPPAAEPRSE